MESTEREIIGWDFLMVDQETLRKAQLKMVEILYAIDDICQRHDIKYWLCYGTLLGAVRHKGFIPWDDDCDICMMREDFEKFSQYVNELPDNLFLQTTQSDPNYHKKIIKIRMKDTKLVESDESENEAYHQGIFVDIFVWDYYDAFSAKILHSIKVINDWRYKRKEYLKGSWQRLVIQIGVALPFLGYSIINKSIRVLSKAYRKNSDLSFVGQEVKVCDNYFYDKNIIFSLQRSEVFEGKKFLVPNNSDAFLKQKYGDYMTLPAPEDRLWHAQKIIC